MPTFQHVVEASLKSQISIFPCCALQETYLVNQVIARGDLRGDSACVDVLLKMGIHEEGDLGPKKWHNKGEWYLPGRQGNLTWRPSPHICVPDERMLDEHV